MTLLKYTSTMNQQDWKINDHKEEIDIMNKLQWQIIKDYLKNGNPHNLHFAVGLNKPDQDESIVTIYNVDENGDFQNRHTFNTCRNLVDYLNRIEHTYSITPEEYEHFLAQFHLHVTLHSVTDISTDDMFDLEEKHDPSAIYYALESNEDNKPWFTASSKDELLQFIAQQNEESDD